MKGTKEFYEVQEVFEKYIQSSACSIYFGCEIVRADKNLKHFYENGKLNDAFVLFMAGYSMGKAS